MSIANYPPRRLVAVALEYPDHDVRDGHGRPQIGGLVYGVGRTHGETLRDAIESGDLTRDEAASCLVAEATVTLVAAVDAGSPECAWVGPDRLLGTLDEAYDDV